MARIPIGVDLDGEGAHPAAWRAAAHAPRALVDPARISARIADIDASGLAFATVPDRSPHNSDPGIRARLDTVEVATFAAAVSTRIGLVPTTNTVHAEPFHLANQLSTLDWAAGGRGGWIARVDGTPATAEAYGRPAPATREAAAAEGRAVVAAVRRLWDTWEDDVLIADEAGLRFLDLDRWHHADIDTEFFRVKGPGLLPRPPQGQLVVWAEPADAADLAAVADVAVIEGATPAAVTERARATRELGIPRRVAAVEIALDADGRRGVDRIADLDRFTPWAPGDRIRLTGSAPEIADALAVIAADVDGIRLHPAVLDVDLRIVAEELLPRLAADGILRTPEAGGTLRELFDLPRPANTFTLTRETR